MPLNSGGTMISDGQSTEVVVAVPSSWIRRDNPAREALLRAACGANLPVKRLLADAIAVAATSVLSMPIREHGNLLVCDAGESAFTASLVAHRSDGRLVLLDA